MILCTESYFKIDLYRCHILPNVIELITKTIVFKERLKWPYALCNHQAYSPHYVWRLAWCLIWWSATFEKVCSYMFIQNTEWTIWYHRTTKTQPILILMIVLYTFSEEAQLIWLYWQARSGITRIAKWTAVHFSNMERNAYQVWMCWNTQSHFKKVMCVIHQMFHLYLNWCNLQKEKITWQLHIYWIFDKMKTVYVCNALQHFFLTYECLFVSYTMQLYIST